MHFSESSASLVWRTLYSLVLCFRLVHSTLGPCGNWVNSWQGGKT